MKGSAADQARPPGHEFAIIFSSLRFWLLIAIALLVSSAVGGVFVHFQPIMQDAGLSISQAASYAAVCGPASIGGHLLAGRLLDRYRAHHVAAIFFGVPAAGCLTLLTYAGSAVQSLTAAVALGFSIGIEGDVMAYLTAQYFGMKRYGVTFGIIIGCYSLGFGLAPVIAGTAFDALGSYVAVLWVMLAGLGVSVLLSLCLGQPPQFLRACSTTPKPASAL